MTCRRAPRKRVDDGRVRAAVEVVLQDDDGVRRARSHAPRRPPRGCRRPAAPGPRLLHSGHGEAEPRRLPARGRAPRRRWPPRAGRASLPQLAPDDDQRAARPPASAAAISPASARDVVAAGRRRPGAVGVERVGDGEAQAGDVVRRGAVGRAWPRRRARVAAGRGDEERALARPGSASRTAASSHARDAAAARRIVERLLAHGLAQRQGQHRRGVGHVLAQDEHGVAPRRPRAARPRAPGPSRRMSSASRASARLVVRRCPA